MNLIKNKSVKYKIFISLIFALFANITVKADDINDTVTRIGDLKDVEVGGKVVQKTYLPFLGDSYVPQGVATTPHGNVVYQAYYYKSVEEENGTTPQPPKKAVDYR
jgi:hypothetical protein